MSISRDRRGCRAKGQEGVVSVMVLVALMGLLGMAALAIDVSMLYVAKQQVQNAADAGALAGVGKMRAGPDEEAICADAVAVAEANMVLGESVQLDAATDVVIGHKDADTGQFVAGWPHDTMPLVKVTVRRTQDSPNGPVPMSFAPLFGIETVEVSATAIAGLTSWQTGRLPVEIVIAQDVSGSFRQELDTAKDSDRALVDIVDGAAMEGDCIGVVRFRGTADRVIDLSGIPDHTSTLHSAIDGIQWGSDLASGTHTGTGFAEAIAIYDEQGSPDREQAIVLVSDGMCFGYAEGHYDQYGHWVVDKTEEQVTAERRQYAIDMADAAAAQGIRIHAITFVQDPPAGYDYGEVGDDAEFNASLVRNGGFAFHTPNEVDLQHILETVGYIEVGHPRLVQ